MLKNYYRSLFAFTLLGSLGLVGCTGDQGEQGETGLDALIRFEEITAGQGSLCPNGGKMLLAGIDQNKNKILDTDEVLERSPICSGKNGTDGFNGLVRRSSYNGISCGENGGVLYEFGLDKNRNNTLDNNEVQSSEPICNGDTGQYATLQTQAIAPGDNECSLGGILLTVGYDANSNGSLEGEEVVRSTKICSQWIDGRNSLIDFEQLNMGSSSCPFGGYQMKTGRDKNDNGILNASEVELRKNICNGSDGKSSQVLTSRLGIGQGGCEFGGYKIETGLDANYNQSLEAAEITTTSIVCNIPVNEQRTLIRYQTIDVGSPTCQWGGVRTNVGRDVNNNGVLEQVEIESTTFNCNQVMVLEGKSSLSKTIPATIQQCLNGGYVIQSGVDHNRNNSLDAGEIINTSLICNGEDARQIVYSVNNASIAECGENGGSILSLGEDLNRNGILNGNEIQREVVICNGLNGLDGLDGFDGVQGSAGFNSLIETFDAGANCPATGFGFETGIDLNRNGILDNNEVQNFEVVCDGLNGLNTLVEISEDSFYCEFGGFVVEAGLDTDEDGFLDLSEIDQVTYACFE